MGGEGGCSLQWPIQGGSAQKGYPSGLQVYKRVAISLVEAYQREGKSVISVCKKAQKG